MCSSQDEREEITMRPVWFLSGQEDYTAEVKGVDCIKSENEPKEAWQLYAVLKDGDGNPVDVVDAYVPRRRDIKAEIDAAGVTTPNGKPVLSLCKRCNVHWEQRAFDTGL